MRESSAENPTILVTGFAPFPGHKANPSGDLLPLIGASPPVGTVIRTQLLPADRDAALLKAIEAMDRQFPDAVIGLGFAEGQSVLSVERVAINLSDRDGPSHAK